eukprot:692143-Prymnesium_polylepis.1
MVSSWMRLPNSAAAAKLAWTPGGRLRSMSAALAVQCVPSTSTGDTATSLPQHASRARILLVCSAHQMSPLRPWCSAMASGGTQRGRCRHGAAKVVEVGLPAGVGLMTAA